MTPAHAHPMVRTADVASLNEVHAPWRIEKVYGGSGRPFIAQARNTATGQVLYRCEGWNQASRGQALAAILEAKAAQLPVHPDRFVTFTPANGYTLHQGDWSQPLTAEQATMEERRGTPLRGLGLGGAA